MTAVVHLVPPKGYVLTECGLEAVHPQELTSDLEKRTCGPCRDALLRRRVCPACGDSDTLTWGTHPKKVVAGVSDGRLTMRDVVTIFYLGCEFCSETILAEVSAEDVALALTRMGWLP